MLNRTCSQDMHARDNNPQNTFEWQQKRKSEKILKHIPYVYDEDIVNVK